MLPLRGSRFGSKNGSMKVLIYGMDAADRGRIGRVLQRLGHEVTAENDCEAAVARIGEMEIETVIADGRIPKFGWMELCRRLRDGGAGPYVYFLLLESRWVDKSHEEWACSAGVDDFLEELADERELRRRLRVAANITGIFQRAQALKSSVPVCRHCKRVRDEQDHWQDIEGSLGARFGMQLSPSICPDCYIRNFGLEFNTSRVAENIRKDLDAP